MIKIYPFDYKSPINCLRPYSRVEIYNRHRRVIQTHSIRILRPNARIMVDPAKYLLVPHQAVFLLENPARILVGGPCYTYQGETDQWFSSGKFNKRLGTPRS
jgi:CDP-diacylglycerol pyrophosphatase